MEAIRIAPPAESEVHFTEPRPTVQIHLPDGRVLEGPRGAQLATLLAPLADPADPTVGAILNSELRELTFPVELDGRARPVTMGEADGMRIYRRSLTFLLAAAFEELFPGARLMVDHSVSSGGYYCEVSGRPPLTAEELARLLARRRKPHLVLYEMNRLRDYHHGYMVPSTGYLRWFALALTNSGFTLRFPRRLEPIALQAPPEYPKLLATFREYGDWLETLGISSVGALNDAIADGLAAQVILVSEALQERRIAEIAAMIAAQRDLVRLVLISGPSASGKTTFSRRLSIQLLARGISPVPIELDNFFVDRVKTPMDEQGQYDYEALDALDRRRLNHDLSRLISGQPTRLPHYNYKSGLQEEGEEARLSPGQILILEGIHGLNPALVAEVPPENTFRVYVSALTH